MSRSVKKARISIKFIKKIRAMNESGKNGYQDLVQGFYHYT